MFRSPTATTKPSEKPVVHYNLRKSGDTKKFQVRHIPQLIQNSGGHPSKYWRSPLPLNFIEQTNTPHSVPQFMKIRRQKKKEKKRKLISRSTSSIEALCIKFVKILHWKSAGSIKLFPWSKAVFISKVQHCHRLLVLKMLWLVWWNRPLCFCPKRPRKRKKIPR